ncbi:ABC transporter permease [Micromonospora sp. WMMC415]|uniref:ABC transporter permease n=1 Tax=Micromonospora sp. WMMC415 TaxID=2675222 RepID=UPI0012B498C7|nr:ABC transporter permease [Micromonospora sp. WMMC415]QGN50499.1 ABC transporter permease [Micromonospora sp. WMMC415]
MQLTLVHTRYQLLETLRIPIAVIGSAFFPAASMLFFVVPFAGGDPVVATYATASMVTFAVMSANIFQYGIGVAEDRQQPWDPYMRTLPAGAFPRFAGRILAGLAMTFLSLIPVVVIAAVLTEARITPLAFLAALGTVLVISVPFTLMGLAIGYSLPSKAAIAVAQIVFFSFAFGGGLFFGGPEQTPSFIETVGPYLPTRGAVELMWGAVGEYSARPISIVMLVVWIVVLAGIAVWAFRRDEGRRFS